LWEWRKERKEERMKGRTEEMRDAWRKVKW